jgi:TolB-like protein/Tfp pilus assembly protein PilF
MSHAATPTGSPRQAPRAEDRLDSWKEIAAYLRRGVRTVKRWEKEEGLPVHRHVHQRLGTVYAYRPELDAWWEARAPRLGSEPQDHAGLEAPQPWRRWSAAGLAVATAALAGFGYLVLIRGTPAPSAPGRVMLAVLPFENLSGDPEQEFFSDGLTEEMITELGQLHPDRLGVIARTSSMAYKGAKKTAAQVASELRVDYLLEGSVRREGERVRISAQLIRAADQTHLWAQNYDRGLGGVVEVQSQVARAIAERIQLALDPDRRRSPQRTQLVHPGAHEAALRGRYFLERRTPDDLRKALADFERAVGLDPGYALAYVGLADTHILSATYADVPPAQAMALARQAVLKALALDEQLPEAHAWLGIILSEYDWDWAGAEQHFRRAIDLNANFAYAHKLYAEYLSYVGRFDEAIAEARLARQLDPLSIVTNALVGVVLYRARRYDEALAELKQTIDMDPDHPMPYLPQGLAYTMKGMHAEAVGALERGLALTPDSTEMIAQLAHAHARAGALARTRAALEELRTRSRQGHVSPFSFALVHVGLGERQEAIDWLERAYQDRDWYLCVLKTEPILDALRPDRRFQDLLRRLNFPAAFDVQGATFNVELPSSALARGDRPSTANLVL